MHCSSGTIFIYKKVHVPKSYQHRRDSISMFNLCYGTVTIIVENYVHVLVHSGLPVYKLAVLRVAGYSHVHKPFVEKCVFMC